MSKVKSLEKFVYVKFRFIGFHRWAEAPPEVGFLREYHRHEFHVTAMARVDHNQRQIEFISLKQMMQAYVDKAYGGETFEYSCEDIAEDLLETFNVDSISVSEDGENGAIINRTKV